MAKQTVDGLVKELDSVKCQLVGCRVTVTGLVQNLRHVASNLVGMRRDKVTVAEDNMLDTFIELEILKWNEATDEIEWA